MKRRIAILGGGCGSMAAAWALTQLPNWSDKYDITVYQLGWRLGGKGASGRQEDQSYRILEHGLHVWGGFYDNAFSVMQQVYGALPPDTGNPLQSWDEAFKRLTTVTLQEHVHGKWINWYLDFPSTNESPGTGGTLIPTIWGYIRLILDWIGSRMIEHVGAPTETPITDRIRAEAATPTQPAHASFLARIFPLHFGENPQADAAPALEGEHPVDLIRAAAALHAALGEDGSQRFPIHHFDMLTLLERAIVNFIKRVEQTNDDVRRLLMVINFGYATVHGIIKDGVLTGGWAAINNYDWSDWLARNGAWESTVNGPLVRGIYDYVFGFVKGDTNDRNLEAGTGTNGCLRLFFTWKGAIFWEMQAGMGDVVFGPMYRVLRNRGVKFEFFSKVLNLGMQNGLVDNIQMSVQATTKSGGPYEALVRVGGVHAWPAHPLYDQLVQGEELREKNIDLESYWADWPGTPKTLQRGVDFDDVVLGISVGAFNAIAPEVKAASEPFRLMVDNLGTVQTAAVQLWIDVKGVDIGASNVGRASTAGVEPMSTWSDMSFLLQREQWPPLPPEGPPPQFIAYFCGAFPDAAFYPPPPNPAFPKEQLDRWIAIATDWLKKNTNTIWPQGVLPDGTTLNWALLHDPSGASGEARLGVQFFKVNIDPSERYVASFKNTSIYRLDAGGSGVKNLFLTGDWVKTSINAGCVEAAVMAGLACASAVSGESIEIVGG